MPYNRLIIYICRGSRIVPATIWAPQVLKLLIVFGVCYAVQFGLVVLMVDRLHWGSSFSQIVVMGAYAALGYLFSRIAVSR